MLKRIFALAAALTLTLALSTHAQEPNRQQQTEDMAKSNIGKTAPQLDINAWLTDKTITQNELAGKPYVLEFWATWCPPCKASIPHLNMVSQSLEPFGLVIIGLTSEDVETAKPFAEEMGMLYYVGADKSTKDGLKFSGIPFAAVVDTKGVVTWAGHPMDPEFGNAVIENVKAYAPEMAEAMQQAISGNMAQAYATVAAMDSVAGKNAVATIESNIAGALKHTETLEGLEKYNALNAIKQFYGDIAGAASVADKIKTLEEDPKVQDAMANQKILQGLEEQVIQLQQQAMKNMQDGMAEKKAAAQYLTQLIPVLEKFSTENPEHPEAKQIQQVLPMMKQELERMTAEPEEAKEAADADTPPATVPTKE